MSWTKRELPWSVYPKGTIARSWLGSRWYKANDGWITHDGDEVAHPGTAYQILIMLPSIKNPIDTVEE